MTRSFEDLSRKTRRLLLFRTLLRAAMMVTAMVVAYYLLPLDQVYSVAVVVWLVAGLLCLVVLIAWQVQRIARSEAPRLRAVEALATYLPLFLLLFSAGYFVLARNQAGAFTESLTRTDALYFTVTVFATVGFGDIAPRLTGARVMVMLQMIGNLILVGVAARVILGAVKTGLERHEAAKQGGEDSSGRG
ncbi:potassium channel family protein [Streptomyces sp. NPDC001139]